jgi:hypothetical protein
MKNLNIDLTDEELLTLRILSDELKLESRKAACYANVINLSEVRKREELIGKMMNSLTN